MGPVASCVLLNERSAVESCNLITPILGELLACSASEDVEAIEDPAFDALVTFQCSTTFLPAPWLRDTILNSDTTRAYELIPLAVAAANKFCHTNEDYPETAIAHIEDFML